MAPITFGSMTMPTAIPGGLRTSGDAGIGFIQNLNSTFTTGETGNVGSGQGAPTLTPDVANDYKNIKTNMEPPQNRSIIGRIADFIVNKKLDAASG